MGIPIVIFGQSQLEVWEALFWNKPFPWQRLPLDTATPTRPHSILPKCDWKLSLNTSPFCRMNTYFLVSCKSDSSKSLGTSLIYNTWTYVYKYVWHASNTKHLHHELIESHHFVCSIGLLLLQQAAEHLKIVIITIKILLRHCHSLLLLLLTKTFPAKVVLAKVTLNISLCTYISWPSGLWSWIKNLGSKLFVAFTISA